MDLLISIKYSIYITTFTSISFTFLNNFVVSFDVLTFKFQIFD